MPSRHILWVSGLLLVGVAIVLVAFLARRPPPAPLRVGLVEWPGFYHLMAATRDGSYTAARLQVELRAFPGNPEANSAFAKGEVDLSLGVLPDALMLAAHGTDLRIIAVIDHSDRADVILVHPAITSLRQLTGATLSFEGVNSFSHLYLLQVLAKAGIPETSVRFVDLPANDVPQAVAEGRITGGHTWGPLARTAERSGYRILSHAGEDPGSITEVLSARVEVLEQRGDEVRRFLATTFAAQARYARDESAVIAHAAAFLGKPVSDLSPVTGEVQLCDQVASRQRLGPDHPLSLHRLMPFIVREFHARGQLPPDYSWQRLIDPGWLGPQPGSAPP